MSEKPGLFKNSKSGLNHNGLDIGYRPDYKPEKPDSTLSAEIQKNEKEKSITMRSTIRIPSDQYAELLALLDISEYSYIYEELGELIDLKVKSLDQAELRMYQNAVSMQRMKLNKKKKNR